MRGVELPFAPLELTVSLGVSLKLQQNQVRKKCMQDKISLPTHPLAGID